VGHIIESTERRDTQSESTIVTVAVKATHRQLILLSVAKQFIFDSSVVPTSDIIYAVPIVLMDTENMEVADGIYLIILYKLRYITLRTMCFRLLAAMFDLLVTPMSKSVQTSIIVLLDPKNVGIADGSSLLSYIQAEIYFTAYVLPVNGGYVWFMSHSDVRECPTMSHCVAVLQKY
jgi:hypothetical protein